MNTTSVIAGIVIILILLFGGWYFFTQTDNTPADVNIGDEETDITNGTNGDTNGEDEGSEDSGSESVAVSYSSSGFSPAVVTVEVGDTVVWANAGGGRMWVASAVHPTHTVYDGTSLNEHCIGGTGSSFDQCAPGSSYSFTFNKVGEWGYHNHARANHTGTVIVTE